MGAGATTPGVGNSGVIVSGIGSAGAVFSSYSVPSGNSRLTATGAGRAGANSGWIAGGAARKRKSARPDNATAPTVSAIFPWRFIVFSGIPAKPLRMPGQIRIAQKQKNQPDYGLTKVCRNPPNGPQYGGKEEWRLGSESNRRTRLCRPLHNHSAT